MVWIVWGRDPQVIHNYGHGDVGWILSWGRMGWIETMWGLQSKVTRWSTDVGWKYLSRTPTTTNMRVCCFSCFKGVSKSVQVLFDAIE